jgi:hypothetical protein
MDGGRDSCPITGLDTASIDVSTGYENCQRATQSNSLFAGNFQGIFVSPGVIRERPRPFRGRHSAVFLVVARESIHEFEQGIRWWLQRISISRQGIKALEHGSFL